MKHKPKARELVWMTLPVLVTVGIAWWRTIGGSLAQLRGVPLGMDREAPRINIESSEPLELSPLDVSEGFVWGRKVILWEGGETPFEVKPGDTISATCDIQADLFFRHKGKWKKVSSKDGRALVRESFGKDSTQFYGGLVLRHTSRIKVRLKGIPLDATEIRLKGSYRVIHFFSRSACGRFIPRPNSPWKFHRSKQCSFEVKSQSFDWPIKNVNESRPNPLVSRAVPLKLIDAKWIVDYGQNYFILQVRRVDGEKWDRGALLVGDVHVGDENGRPLKMGSSSASINQSMFSPQRAETDLFIPFVWPDDAHDESYEVKAKGPLTLCAKVSDWHCWPLDINVRVPRVHMKLRDFGVASTTR